MVGRILFSLFALVSASVLRADPTDGEVLGRDLRSLRVTLVDAKAMVVNYLPIKVRFVDNQGKVQKALSWINLGNGKGLVQGRFALIGEENELAELEKRVQKALPGCLVRPSKFEAFGLRLRHDDKTVWERPVAGGDASRIVFQGVCDGEGDLKLEGLLVWVEHTPPVYATVRFDLERVAKTVESRFGLNGIIPLVEWTKLSDELLEDGAITVKVDDNQPKVAKDVLLPLIAKHIQRVLTDEKVVEIPPKKDEDSKPKTDDKKDLPKGLHVSLTIGYRVSKTKQLGKQDETLNLSASQPVRRTLPISEDIPVQKQAKK